MPPRRYLTLDTCAVLLLFWFAPLSFAQGKEKKDRTGAIVGIAVAKGGNWIEVKADGEEKARKYYTGSDPVALKAVKTTSIGSRVRLEWRFNEVFRVVRIELLKAAPE